MDNINLDNLPKDFDRSLITMPDINRKWSNALRLAKCDFEPIERGRFNGWFGIYNGKVSENDDRAKVVGRIIATGGNGYINLVTHGIVQKRIPVRILGAYIDGKYVIVHIEPVK